MMKNLLISIALILVFVGISHAKLYKWVDGDGVTHYSNTAPPQDENISAETKNEVVNSTPDNYERKDLDHVINSYKMDSLEDKKDEIEKLDKKSKSNKIDNILEKHNLECKKHIAHLEFQLKMNQERLRNVDRETYSDKRKHDKDVRFQEEMVDKYESLLEEAKDNCKENRKLIKKYKN